jgi:hypothetical protein
VRLPPAGPEREEVFLGLRRRLLGLLGVEGERVGLR